MPIKVLELHHHGIRVGNTDKEVEQARYFYSDILGIPTDSERPEICGIPGYWLDVGEGKSSAQIHLMGAVGVSPAAQSANEDPTMPHVALAVESIEEAKKDLARQGIWFWQLKGLVGENADQIFVQDPFGNVIELHQIGTCRCKQSAR